MVFSPYGKVISVKLLGVLAGKPDRSALVRMSDVAQAAWMLENLNNNVPPGLVSPITLRYAENRTQKARELGLPHRQTGPPNPMTLQQTSFAAAYAARPNGPGMAMNRSSPYGLGAAAGGLGAAAGGLGAAAGGLGRDFGAAAGGLGAAAGRPWQQQQQQQALAGAAAGGFGGQPNFGAAAGAAAAAPATANDTTQNAAAIIVAALLQAQQQQQQQQSPQLQHQPQRMTRHRIR